MGEHWAGTIYVQEVAALLGLPEPRVFQLCDELFLDEKLDLDGAILSHYIPRFRFPKEIETLIAYIVEEPLGWPNGDVGSFLISELEHAIHAHSRFKHGKHVFGEENYPHIAARHLLSFAQQWAIVALRRARENPKALEDIRSLGLERMAELFDGIAQGLREVGERTRL